MGWRDYGECGAGKKRQDDRVIVVYFSTCLSWPFRRCCRCPFRIRHPSTFASYTRSSTATHDHLINIFRPLYPARQNVKHVIIIAPRGPRIIIMFPASIVPYASGFWLYPPSAIFIHSFYLFPVFVIFNPHLLLMLVSLFLLLLLLISC